MINFFFYIDIMRIILKEYEKSGMFCVISMFYIEVFNLLWLYLKGFK